MGTSSVVVSSGLLAWQVRGSLWTGLPPLQMYNVKQTQSEMQDMRERLSLQQQRIQLNELSSEREGGVDGLVRKITE